MPRLGVKMDRFGHLSCRAGDLHTMLHGRGVPRKCVSCQALPCKMEWKPHAAGVKLQSIADVSNQSLHGFCLVALCCDSREACGCWV